jgi:signal transduction histidine kinase
MEKQATYSNMTKQIEQNISNLNNLQFLIDATNILSTSLDYEKTLQQVAELAVPKLADWCTIHIKDEVGQTEQIVVEHVDPKKIALALQLQKEFPPDPDAHTGVDHVMRTGKPEMMAEIPEQLILKNARNKHHRKLLEELNLKSYMCVPLQARGKTLGAITFVSAESGRIYTENDLHYIEDLSRIAAIAVDNALLFHEAQVEIEKRKKAEAEIIQFNKNLEQKVQERTLQLERSNRELQDFAYVASHDLQEPLRKIQAFSDLLQEEYGSQLQDGKQYLDRILNAAGRMRILIDDLLAFSRITTKALPFTKVNLNIILTEVLADMEMTIKDADGKVTLATPLPELEADPIQMRQLLQNIISNAIKFHKKGVAPSIVVSAIKTTGKKIHETSQKTGIYWQIAIQDNGIGFDEKYLDRIFTIFERLHGRRDFSGTGIGLAVCRKIVERHAGTITAKSQPNTGTTFMITLPEKQSQAEKGGDKDA